jgi:hypothetical protein
MRERGHHHIKMQGSRKVAWACADLDDEEVLISSTHVQGLKLPHLQLVAHCLIRSSGPE